MRRTLRLVLVAMLVLSMLWAFSYHIHQQANSIANNSATAKVPVQVVKHVMGETAVSLHPQRVVSLHWYATEAAISLGVKLKGTPRTNLHPMLIQDDVADIGWFPINIEKVLTLKPDLLVGSVDLLQAPYSLWSHIAPTVVFTLKGHEDWKQPFTLIAESLRKTEAAKQIEAQYNARVAEFKRKMDSQLKKTRVSVVALVQSGNIIVLTKKAFCGVILEELGLERPSSQALDAATLKVSGNSISYTISPEMLPKIDADIMFVFTWAFPTPANSQKALKQLMAQPLWSKLKVVQQRNVHVVGEYWLYGSYLSANRVLDDLFRYLVQEQ